MVNLVRRRCPGVSLTGKLFAKFQPEKYDFALYKGFFMEKNDPNLPDFEDLFIYLFPKFSRI